MLSGGSHRDLPLQVLDLVDVLVDLQLVLQLLDGVVELDRHRGGDALLLLELRARGGAGGAGGGVKGGAEQDDMS